MSAFPRMVPRKLPDRMISKNWNRGLTLTIVGSPLYVYYLGEWRGWWKRFEAPAPGSSEASYLEILREDLRAQSFFNLTGVSDSSITSHQTWQLEHQRESMSSEIKDFIRTGEENDGIAFTSTIKDKSPVLYESSGSKEESSISTPPPTSSQNQLNLSNQNTENPPIEKQSQNSRS